MPNSLIKMEYVNKKKREKKGLVLDSINERSGFMVKQS